MPRHVKAWQSIICQGKSESSRCWQGIDCNVKLRRFTFRSNVMYTMHVFGHRGQIIIFLLCISYLSLDITFFLLSPNITFVLSPLNITFVLLSQNIAFVIVSKYQLCIVVSKYYLCLVTSEICNVFLDPLESQRLIKQSSVPGHLRGSGQQF